MTLNLHCTAHNKCYLIPNCRLKSLYISKVTVWYIGLFGDAKLPSGMSATWQRIPDPDGGTFNKVQMKPDMTANTLLTACAESAKCHFIVFLHEATAALLSLPVRPVLGGISPPNWEGKAHPTK